MDWDINDNGFDRNFGPSKWMKVVVLKIEKSCVYKVLIFTGSFQQRFLLLLQHYPNGSEYQLVCVSTVAQDKFASSTWSH